MTTLRQAIENVAQCATPSTKFARPIYRMCDGKLFAYNGTLGASTPFVAQFPHDDIAVDADSLSRVWQDSSKATIEDRQLVVRNRRTTYRLPLQETDTFVCPELIAGGEKITPEQRDAILLASKFASTNAIHPWAAGVTLHEGRAIATNNLTVISVKCETHLEGTMPFWAVGALRTTGEPPAVRIDEHGVSFTYDDGTIIQSAPLAAAMPSKLFELIATINEGDTPITNLLEAAEDAFRIPGKRVTLDPAAKRIIVVAENGTRAETEVDLGDTNFEPAMLQEPILKLIMENASHFSFAEAPSKLLFSSNTAPEFRAIAACMV
jgi:hypothetical protein